MNGLKRGALALGVAGLMLSAGAAGFSGGGAATSDSVRTRPPTPCAAVDASYDALEANPVGATTAFWEAAEHTAQVALDCRSDADAS